MRSEIHPLRLTAKGLFLFLIANLLFALLEPPYYRLSLYNTLIPGRVRLPFSDEEGVYSVMVDDIDVMMASHEVSAPKDPDEFRVVLLGDSSVWGEDSPVSQSISVLWNKTADTCNGRKLEYYNLAYPHPSVVKDLIILKEAMAFDPDLVVWFVTLNSLTTRRLSPFILANADRAVQVLDTYAIPYDPQDAAALSRQDTWYEKTLLGRRSDLARMVKLQALGVLWALGGTDGYVPEGPAALPSNDVRSDRTYKDLESVDQLQGEIMWSALAAGHDIAGQVPLLVINEPIFIASGANSDVRYNIRYPRWAYDYYRDELQSTSQTNQWNYLDLWDSVPAALFPDSFLHILPEGRQIVIEKTDPVLQNIACR